MQVLSLAWLCTKTQTSQITHLTRIYTDQKSCKSRLFSDETSGSWLFRCWRLRVIPAIPLGFQFWQFRRFWQFWQSPVALCLCPSARTPPPHKRFVENKSQTPIRPNGRPNGRSPFFPFFRASIRLNFSLVFSFLLSGRQRVATP